MHMQNDNSILLISKRYKALEW